MGLGVAAYAVQVENQSFHQKRRFTFKSSMLFDVMPQDEDDSGDEKQRGQLPGEPPTAVSLL